MDIYDIPRYYRFEWKTTDSAQVLNLNKSDLLSFFVHRKIEILINWFFFKKS